MNCLECKTETKNPKFCSCSCAAIYNNKKYPKRRWKCKKCKREVRKPSKYATICSHCKKISTEEYLTLGELRSRGWSSRQTYCQVRRQARIIIVAENRNKCEICEYDKHVEACHIKPIKDFSDNSTIKEVNSNNNLLALCRNCHWELDNGLINIFDN